MDYQLITTPDALATLCEQFAQSEWLCVDTEFLRNSTYFPKLCLLQISNADLVAIIDPLSIRDLEPLRALLLDPNITKVLHSCEQDLEIFYHLWECVPTPIFDTQVAAAFLGYGPQIGYGKLVEQITGKVIDKSYSRNDWARRPLSDKEMAYAAGDVIWLRDVYKKLRQELDDKNRLEWLNDDFAKLTNPTRYAVNIDRAWKKVKGLQRLRPKQQKRGAAIASWREQKAVMLNKPRGRIIQDAIVLDLAKRELTAISDLERMQGISAGQIKQWGTEIVAAATKAEAIEIPSQTRKAKLSNEQRLTVDILLALAQHYARLASVSEENLGGRAAIEKLISGSADNPLMQGWRYDAVGKHIEALLAGESALIFDDNLIQLPPRL